MNHEVRELNDAELDEVSSGAINCEVAVVLKDFFKSISDALIGMGQTKMGYYFAGKADGTFVAGCIN
jgi:hypothetical protein